MINIVEHFKTKAESMGWHFVFGNDADINRKLTQLSIRDGANVLILFDIADMTIIESGEHLTDEVQFNVLFFLGRKTEGGVTVSKLDETLEQKFDNRLYELADESKLFVRRLFSCEGKCRNVRLTHRLNKFSSNIDAIGVQLNIIV